MDSEDLQLVEDPLSGFEAGPSRPADVMIIDAGGEPGTALEGARRLRRQDPRLPAVILGHDVGEARAAGRGAHAYLLDNAPPTLIRGIIREAAGRSSTAGLTDPEDRSEQEAQLTLREAQVLGLIAEGLTNREIGQRLGLAVKTVKNYSTSLFAKLHVEHRTQAVIYRLSGHRGVVGSVGERTESDGT
ncbi:response regulator transcription factor [Zhihengliuella sp. ISTPL4]|uniref:response regulator transcription factor n=1 Tax=Zhihengliuella sp. ISTPL4 TaxID=2058657 RepID=UPI0013051D5A|nr:response regulator transcription factor [Zhihengliuella sp. ISTPL4]